MCPSFHIKFVPPPGPTVDGYDRLSPASGQKIQIPLSFRQCMQVREAVFVGEQGIPLEYEFDDHDAHSFHWIALAIGNDTPVGTVRIIPPVNSSPTLEVPKVEDRCKPYITLGRLAVTSSHRGLGISRALVDAALEWASRNPELVGRPPADAPTHGSADEGVSQIGCNWAGFVLVHAQTDVEGLYAKMGFYKDNKIEPWIEDGILHVAMWKKLNVRL